MVMNFDGKTTTVKRNAKTVDIIQALIDAVPNAVKQFKKVPTTIYTGNAKQDAKAACFYVRDRVKYKADGFNFQDIQAPGRMFNDTKQADCKSFSLAALANILSKGYNGGFRFVSYRQNKIPTHVYIYVLDKSGNKLTFDPCIKNLKESPKATYILDMDVRYLSMPYNYGIEGKKERQKRREERKAKKAAGNDPKGLPKITLAPARGAFLGLLALNFRGLATRLDKAIKKDSQKVQAFWNKLGGDFSKLKNNVDNNKGKKPLLGTKGIDGIGTFEDYYLDDSFIGLEPVTTAAAAAATASPILLALKKFLADLKIEDVVDAAGKVVPLLTPNEAAATTAIDEKGEGFQASDPEPGSSPKNPKGSSFAPSPILIGGLAAAGILVYLLTKKKRK
jgi:hypothetical protein